MFTCKIGPNYILLLSGIGQIWLFLPKYSTRSIITCGLYTFYHIFEGQKRFLRSFFRKNSDFNYSYHSWAVSNQDLVICSGARTVGGLENGFFFLALCTEKVKMYLHRQVGRWFKKAREQYCVIAKWSLTYMSIVTGAS